MASVWTKTSKVSTQVILLVFLILLRPFLLQPYRSETYRTSLFREHSGRTDDMDTIDYVRYDTIEVENDLYTNKCAYNVDARHK